MKEKHELGKVTEGGEGMDRHINALNIECYRGLKDLRLQDLNDINILTGNNNSGKTSVLELISSLDSPQDLSTWIKMCRLDGGKNYYRGILNLFPTDAEDMRLHYSYMERDLENIVAVNAQIQEERMLESDIDRINGVIREEYYQKNVRIYGSYVDTRRVIIHIFVNGAGIGHTIYDFQTKIAYEKLQQKHFPVIYVSPSAHTNGEIFLDDVMESPALYQRLMKILNEFDDSIMNITKSGNGTEYMILSYKRNKAMPLSVYGDGMKKALALLAAVVKAKDGILLLDEFETAIHTSAMNNIFAWILQSAQKLNVQVFMSSHSLEAIDKVLKCSPELQDRINLYTLYNKEGKSLVRKMSCTEAIKAQDDWGVELR